MESDDQRHDRRIASHVRLHAGTMTPKPRTPTLTRMLAVGATAVTIGFTTTDLAPLAPDNPDAASPATTVTRSTDRAGLPQLPASRQRAPIPGPAPTTTQQHPPNRLPGPQKPTPQAPAQPAPIQPPAQPPTQPAPIQPPASAPVQQPTQPTAQPTTGQTPVQVAPSTSAASPAPVVSGGS